MREKIYTVMLLYFLYILYFVFMCLLKRFSFYDLVSFISLSIVFVKINLTTRIIQLQWCGYNSYSVSTKMSSAMEGFSSMIPIFSARTSGQKCNLESDCTRLESQVCRSVPVLSQKRSLLFQCLRFLMLKRVLVIELNIVESYTC